MTEPILPKPLECSAESISADDTHDGRCGCFPPVLVDRYRRFKYRHFGPNIEHYKRLATFGQHPDVMIVSCCDSRVDPETIFSALPGELFIMRNVANLVPPYETDGKYHGVSAALEFAALNLRVGHVVVMGHAGCGGVKACLDHSAARQTAAQFISGWISMLDDAREKVLAAYPGAEMRELQRQLEFEGVKTSIANLRTFPCVQQLEAKGRVKLHGAYFDIEKGTLWVLNETAGAFVEL